MTRDDMTTRAADDTPEFAQAARIATLEMEVRGLRADHEALRGQITALMEVERFRDVILQRHTPAHAPAPPHGKLEAREFAEQSDNLHYLEYGPDGAAYRWTGPGHVTRVRFSVDRSVPVMVTLRLVSLGSHTGQDRITLEVDGASYPMRLTTEAGTVLEAGPILPRGGRGPTELLFHCPVLFSPGESDDRDARRLGVAMRSVEIGPV